MGQRRLLVLLCCIVFVACRGSGAGPTPSVSTPVPTDEPSPTVLSSPTATPTATPTASVGPGRTAPPRTGAPTAKVERDGILVELWLPEEVAAIGERFFAHVRITNTGVRRFQQIDCDGPADITVDYRAALPPSRDWHGIAGQFKARFLSEARYGEAAFSDIAVIDREHFGCADVLIVEPVEPGTVLEETLAWDLEGYLGRPLVPGPATLEAAFRFWPTQAAEGERQAVAVEADIQIGGVLTPGWPLAEYVDLALSEPRFDAWLEEQPVETWINTNTVAWPNEEGEYPRDPCYQGATDGALDIGLFRDVDQTVEYGSVTLDLPSGEVLGVRFEGEGGRVYCD